VNDLETFRGNGVEVKEESERRKERGNDWWSNFRTNTFAANRTDLFRKSPHRQLVTTVTTSGWYRKRDRVKVKKKNVNLYTTIILSSFRFFVHYLVRLLPIATVLLFPSIPPTPPNWRIKQKSGIYWLLATINTAEGVNPNSNKVLSRSLGP